jgi:hypothetical protein
MPDHSLTPPALRHQRERTIAELCEHFAQDHLEAEELELLIDRAHQSTTLAELEGLVHGLPGLRPANASAAAPHPGYSIAVPGETRDQQWVVAVMGGNERAGSWAPARSIYVVAVMGGVSLDFREARMDPGVTEVYCFAWMGGVEIIVPPGLRVESNGVGIMGGFEHVGAERLPVDTSVPVLRISGAAVMGGVEITQREPGESAGEARRRVREEQRTRRELRRQDPRRLGRGGEPI